MEATLAIDDKESIGASVAAFLNGAGALTGLDLYYELERSTCLLSFHTMIRAGPQNLTASGLQQSYGDHNRLLMLGLDKLVEGDLVWYRRRLDGARDVSDDDLLACFDAVGELGLTREVLLALWLAGALHDCGTLVGRVPFIDVEDGVVLGRDIIEALVPDGFRNLAYFVIHQHDYIKDVFLGEVPISYVADELATLPVDLRRLALAALGLVQVAGAASLGDGRLGSFRVEVFRRCLDGTALIGETPLTRLARLLTTVPAVTAPSDDFASAAMHEVEEKSRPIVGRFLHRASLHGWHRVVSKTPFGARLQLLTDVASLWERAAEPAHVIMSDDGHDRVPERFGPDTPTREAAALNGSRILVIGT